MSSPTAHILLVGDELLAGEVVDANGPFFAETLSAQGYRIQYIGILPDEQNAIVAAVRQATASADLTIVCGGLGPTSDDLTTEAVGEALGRKLVLVEEQWQRIRMIFQALRQSEPPPGNEKQATIPEGADVLPNPHGTAIGYAQQIGSRAVAVFPGPPNENRPMLQSALLPWLAGRQQGVGQFKTDVFRIFGLPESIVGHRLEAMEAQLQAVKVAYQYHFPEILVKLRYDQQATAEAQRAKIALREALAPHLYADGNDALPAVLGRTLAARQETIAVAESCTGGLAGKLLTDTAGSSAWFDRGFVTYTNVAKREVLRVPRETLQQYGAVSEETALAMLEGTFERSSAQYAFAITGIAGPGGGSDEKPVGTVCIAWGSREGMESTTQLFRWGRDYNRLISAWTAMWKIFEMVREA